MLQHHVPLLSCIAFEVPSKEERSCICFHAGEFMKKTVHVHSDICRRHHPIVNVFHTIIFIRMFTFFIKINVLNDVHGDIIMNNIIYNGY